MIQITKCKCDKSPDCPECRGSGIAEANKEARIALDEAFCDDLDKIYRMEKASINWEELSDQEFDNFDI